jgi:tetratricopeptide (TPR) repeat protein
LARLLSQMSGGALRYGPSCLTEERLLTLGGDFDRALSEFENSIILCPQNAWVYYHRAEAYERRGRTAEALENYRLALTMKSP